MSKKGDFLSGFSGGNTQKPLTEKNEEPVKEATPPEKEVKNDTQDTSSKTDATKVDATKVAENKKLADKIVEESQKKDGKSTSTAPIPGLKTAATRPAQSASAIIKAPEHVVTKDNTFHKRQMTKYGIIGGVAIVVAIIGFIIFRITDIVEVPNFIEREAREAEVWQLTPAGASVSIEHEYSLRVNEGLIMGQSIEAGETMSRRATLTVVVSRGPNMNEVVALPDFYEMTRAQIRTWQEDYRMRVNFSEENHPTIEQHHVVRVDFAATVDPDNFRRSDSVTIVVSTGPETITLPNFVGNNPEELAEWISENPEVDVEIEYEPHPTIERGYVLRQSENPRTNMALDQTLVITVSAGQPVEVPNFANMRRREALDMMEEPTSELVVRVIQRWDASIPYGRFVSQSVEAGTELYGADRSVTVVYSLGRPWVEPFSNERDAEEGIVRINDLGSFLTVRFIRVNHWFERGRIVSQSHFDQRVSLDQEIVIEISLGNLDPPVDYIPEPPMDMPPGDDGDFDFDY